MDTLMLKVAAKALIVNNEGKILLVRESGSYKDGSYCGSYMCPGGRLDAGESYKSGLLREVKEETGLDVEPLYPVYVGEWRPTIRGVPHQIIGIFTVCALKSNAPVSLSEDHDAYEWVDPLDTQKFAHLLANSHISNREAVESYVRYSTSMSNTSVCAALSL